MFADIAIAPAGAFLVVALGVVAVGLWLTGCAVNHRRAIERLRDLEDPPTVSEESATEAVPRWWSLSNLMSLFSTGENRHTESLRQQLVYAGYSGSTALQYFVGCRFFMTVVLAIAGGLAAWTYARPSATNVVLSVVAGGAVGFLLPKYMLASRVDARQRLLSNTLPDALDMLVLCLEGGSSLPASVNWVADEIQHVHPALGAEFAIIRRKMQMGLTGGEAFQALADRTGIADIRELSQVLLQSERYGASTAKAMRSFADNGRQARQYQAEETAQKAAVKIVFPTLLCIFPATFIVLIGPASFQIAKLFAK